jgi:hypothetical protein
MDYVKGESAVPITTRADLLPFPLRIHSLSSTLEHYFGVKNDAKNPRASHHTLKPGALAPEQIRFDCRWIWSERSSAIAKGCSGTGGGRKTCEPTRSK